MDTKLLINSALASLGEYGFSGVTLSGESLVDALSALLQLDPDDAHKLVAELRRQSLAEITSYHDEKLCRLTPKGFHRLQQSLINSLSVAPQAIWDHRWRMILFDVPIRHNRRRTVLSTQLKRMGFVMLRDSTWVYPYPCFTELDQLVRYCNLVQFVTYAEVSKLDTPSHSRLLRSFPDL